MNKILLSIVLLLLTSVSIAAEPVSKSYFSGVAIDSHDTVAYHSPEVRSEHQEVKGEKSFTVKWGGAKWRFASQQSADKFAADPERYKPEYNGHCANALSLGEGLIKTDGTIWEFFGDELHLFYAERGRQRWLQGDWQAFKQVASKEWKRLSQ